MGVLRWWLLPFLLGPFAVAGVLFLRLITWSWIRWRMVFDYPIIAPVPIASCLVAAVWI